MKEVLGILQSSDKSMDLLSIVAIYKKDYDYKDIQEVQAYLNDAINNGEVIQRKDGRYLNIEKSNAYKKGKIQVTEKGYGFVLLDNEDDLFIPRNKLNGAEDGDVVLARIVQRNTQKTEGEVEKILKKSLHTSLAQVYENKGKYTLKLLDDDSKNLVLVGDTHNIVDGSIVKVNVISKDKKNNYAVEIEKVIGHKNAPDIDILKIVEEYEVPSEFSQEAMNEADNMPSSISDEDIKDREDLRSKMIFTIDGKDTKDIDDAISLEILDNGHFLLGVHIADVTHYVKEGSILKKEAFERGNSNYLADRVIPMLPPSLSNGICSLNEGVDRLAMSCEMEIDYQGNVVSSRIFKSVINSNKKMNYDDVNTLFETGKAPIGYERYEDMLNDMLKLSKILKRNKYKRGELEFESSERKLIVDENGLMTGITRREQKDAETLIEDFMICANETVAYAVSSLDLPFVYRVHDIPNKERLKEFITFLSIMGIKIPGKLNYNGKISPKEFQKFSDNIKCEEKENIINKKKLRCMAKARYDKDNIGHFGLGSKCYTHFTSPIRRYADLTVHYLLKEYIINNNEDKSFTTYWANALTYICDHISKTERTSMELERTVEDMKIAQYMESHIGDEYKAIIDTTLSRGFFVETEELINGFVPLEVLDERYSYNEELLGYMNNKKQIVLQIGDEVEVKCISASKEERKVDFTLVKKIKK